VNNNGVEVVVDGAAGAFAILASLISLMAGLIGIIRPKLIKLSSRFQAAFVASLPLPLIGLGMYFSPGKDTATATIEQTRQAGIGLTMIWFGGVALAYGVKLLISKERGTSGAPAEVASGTTQKVSFLRAISSTMSPELRRTVVAEVRKRSGLKEILATDIAAEFDITERLASTLINDARKELTEEALAVAWASRTLVNADQRTAATNIGLAHDDFDKLWAGFVKRASDAVLDDALQDGQLTPEECDNLEQARAMLDVDFSKRQSEIDEAKKMWRVCNAELEPTDVPVMLKRNEVCFGHLHAEGQEMRTRTRSVSYGGPSARIRIAKGISYNVGSRRISTRQEEYTHSFGSGKLFVTNSRLIWAGDKRTLNIPYGKIINVDAFSDGVTIYKDTGKPVTFSYGRVDRVFTALILRVVEEYR
jgi:hypothetical protein